MVTLLDLVVLLVALVVLWIVVSLPVYAAAKLVTKGKATIGEAMAATLGGAVIYFVVLVVVDFFASALFGHLGFVLAFLLAFVAWLAVYKSVFETNWLGAVGIAILAAILIIILNVFLVALFGVAIPAFFHPF
ncbi:MAG: hypothetical protein OK456_01050 [Thaumarchaeota archaeon]|nr:hypothetical protein [Nitrososphaerota archaeon]